jgi:hypothetical protein
MSAIKVLRGYCAQDAVFSTSKIKMQYAVFTKICTRSTYRVHQWKEFAGRLKEYNIVTLLNGKNRN